MSFPGETYQDSTCTFTFKYKLGHSYKLVLPSISEITLNYEVKNSNIKEKGKISFTPLKTAVYLFAIQYN